MWIKNLLYIIFIFPFTIIQMIMNNLLAILVYAIYIMLFGIALQWMRFSLLEKIKSIRAFLRRMIFKIQVRRIKQFEQIESSIESSDESEFEMLDEFTKELSDKLNFL